MEDKKRSYQVRKASESLPHFFGDITREIISDSRGVYYWILLLSASSGVLGFAFSRYMQLDLAGIHTKIIEGFSAIYLLLPPFVLAIIAMFPAFSDKTKEVLSRDIGDGKAFGAVFLNEFAFLTFWSLCVLAHNIISTTAYTFIPTEYSPSWIGYLVAINFSLSTGMILSVAFEIFHSIKIMYLLVLKEYYK